MMYDIETGFDPSIMQAFRQGKAKDVLKDTIYGFREHSTDKDFHFLIGLCMLQMGYYEEALAAFRKSQSNDQTGSRRADVFAAYVLLMAQKDDVAKETLSRIPLDNLTPSETVAIMSIKSSLGMDMKRELHHIIAESDFASEADRLALSTFAFKYAGMNREASETARAMSLSVFKDIPSYLYVAEEIYKLHMENEADELLGHVHAKATELSGEDFLAFIKSCYACSYYSRLDWDCRRLIWEVARKDIPEHHNEVWAEAVARLHCMEFERLSSKGKKRKAHSLIAKMRRLPETEQVLLYLVTYDIARFDEADKPRLKEMMEKLIGFNQTNLRYRKLYCDFLRVTGYLSLSDDVAKATVSMRKKQEADEFTLVKAFHSFYMPRPCMMTGMPVHGKDDGGGCPVCFGAGEHPIVRAIGFGHTPSNIFTDNMESHIIEPNEAMLRDLVRWQPMNVASPLIARYLHTLGAYMSSRAYPDVLVPGQTYIYLSLKPQAKERLLSEGYSLLQIDPYEVAMDVKGIEDADGKEISDNTLPLSAKDFTVEIIHAISSQEDLDAPLPFPEPESYSG